MQRQQHGHVLVRLHLAAQLLQAQVLLHVTLHAA
jgi:hypothetical protein